MTENKWITQAQLASELDITIQAVNNWIKRGHVKYKKNEQYGITLVDRTSVKVNPTSGRPKKAVAK